MKIKVDFGLKCINIIKWEKGVSWILHIIQQYQKAELHIKS